MSLRYLPEHAENALLALESTLPPISPSIDALLRDVLARFPDLMLALVFGSVAQGRQRADSD